MGGKAETILARARTDADDRLIVADELLARLQSRCGGQIPGIVAVPELLALIRKARHFGLRLARTIRAIDGEDAITAWVEVAPEGNSEKSGCTIAVGSWQATPYVPDEHGANLERRVVIERSVAELYVRLDPSQAILTAEASSAETKDLAEQMNAHAGRSWTDFVEIAGNQHHQPMHWRLLDGAQCRIEGSERVWAVVLLPQGKPQPGSAGFDLYLVPDAPARPGQMEISTSQRASTVGREISPVLRQPVSRIIANAETIRSRLAGPLAEEYSQYATDIAEAGQHLLGLLDDLADLEVVEAENFVTAPDKIDLQDVAKRAIGILGVRAQDKGIKLSLDGDDSTHPAVAEFRRVLQILLNLIGNAIRYAPAGSTVSVGFSREGEQARVTISDQGDGIAQDQREAVFEKFERLGRAGDGGSGLGLYISRRLARAMDGDLTVGGAPGGGARFVVSLPADLNQG